VRGTPYTVSYDNRAILINGERVFLQSGSVHYGRPPAEMWTEIIAKAKQHGLNTIQTYVFWNMHEATKGVYDFSTDNRNLTQFLQVCADAGLFVNLRIGPYACAEWNYGGFPIWLKFEEGIVFRTENKPWLDNMKTFTQRVLQEVEPYLNRNGGPIILAQIENEYGGMEGYYGDAGKEYVQDIGHWVMGLDLGIQWIMCIQDDAPDGVINTENGFYADGWIEDHVKRNPDQPQMWTENWNGWFQHWGETSPHRPIEDVLFAIARWVMKGGTHHNYYMFFGGTNFARWVGGPNIVTSYDYDVALNEYGLPNPEKFNKSSTIHWWLTNYAANILGEDEIPALISLGPSQEASIYGKTLIFLANIATESADVVVPNTNVTMSLPAWSVSFWDVTQGAVVFNTATGPWLGDEEKLEQNATEGELVATDDEPLAVASFLEISGVITRGSGDDSFLCAFDGGFSFFSVALDAPHALEQIATTRDSTDYLLYRANVTITQELIDAGAAPMSIAGIGDFAQVRLTQSSSGAVAPRLIIDHAIDVLQPENFTIELSTSAEWTAGNAELWILTMTLGLQNYGPFLEQITRGLEPNATVAFAGRDYNADPAAPWEHQIGLQGEAEDWVSAASNDTAVWRETDDCGAAPNIPFVWYRLNLSVSLDSDPTGVFALDMNSMGKGAVWVNGNHIGRYYLKIAVPSHTGECDPCNYAGKYDPGYCRSGCNEPSQRYYHVPRAWLKDGANEITVLEELGGGGQGGYTPAPQSIAFVRRN
jgi:hypothetical protein